MKTKLLIIAMIALSISSCQAQNQTTVYAKNSDISDNLDLRAVASIFGESANLQDFERRLNDPSYQISNLDLNGDNQVDYLRVIESVEDRTHVVIIQAVLDRDVFQDIATIDIERDNTNRVVVQVVGNSYLYGNNYIYEPVYSVAPVIYTSFWVTNYRPYYSTWGWNYYPTYYSAWRPYPIYRYRRNVNVYINVNNHYNYVDTRRSYRAPAIYETRRSYGYEKMRPNNSFSQRNSNVNNRYELDQRRIATGGTTRGQNTYSTNRSTNNNNRSNSGRVTTTPNQNTRNTTSNRTTTDRSTTNRDNSASTTNPVRVQSDRSTGTNRGTSNRDNGASTTNPVRVQTDTRRNSTDNNTNNTRVNSENRSTANRSSTAAPVQRTEAPRSTSQSNRSASQNNASTTRSQAPQRSESSRGSQESRSSQPQRESGSNSRSEGGRR